jgi:hypothetical protein
MYLRAAIQQANLSTGNADTVTFNLPPASLITINTVLPEITNDMAFTGPSSNQLMIMRSTIGGTANFRSVNS